MEGSASVKELPKESRLKCPSNVPLNPFRKRRALFENNPSSKKWNW